MPLSDADKRALAEEVESARRCGEVAYWRLPWSTLFAVAAELDRLTKIETAVRALAEAADALLDVTVAATPNTRLSSVATQIGALNRAWKEYQDVT